MVSNVKYSRWPRIGFRSFSGILGIVLHLGIIAGAVLLGTAYPFEARGRIAWPLLVSMAQRLREVESKD